jgi:HPt (histidine-containing phosphotransfer) domain-containing protein
MTQHQRRVLVSIFALCLTTAPILAARADAATSACAQTDKPGDLLSIDFESLLNVKVITASKSAETLADAPGVISVVTRDELQRFGGITLGEILQRVPGLTGEDALRHRLSGDSGLMTDVIGLFLDDLPVRLAAVQGAVTNRNADAQRAAAHALKGSAGNLSVGSLFEAARVLERLGAESRMGAAEAAWRHLSVEASHVVDVLRCHSPSVKEPFPCAS